jgi:hypothetical protein
LFAYSKQNSSRFYQITRFTSTYAKIAQYRRGSFTAKLFLPGKIKYRIFSVNKCRVVNDYWVNFIQISELPGKIRRDL